MTADIVMPFLAETMEEGTVGQWLKSTGDPVAIGDPLLEIETDKTTSVLESDVAGVLAEILVPAGETVPVGTVIARVE